MRSIHEYLKKKKFINRQVHFYVEGKCTNAVSYTHLDVYKRQAPEFTENFSAYFNRNIFFYDLFNIIAIVKHFKVFFSVFPRAGS